MIPLRTRMHFATFGDAYDAAMRTPQGRQCIGHPDTAWAGSPANFERFAKAGDQERAERVAALFDRITAQLPPTHGHDWAPTVAGGCVNVGDALSGEPLAFRSRVIVQNETRPVRIVCDIAHSWSVSTRVIEERGAAIAALAVNVAAFRPVELCAASIGSRCQRRKKPQPETATLVTVDVDPRTADLSSVAFALVHPGALRRIVVGLMNAAFRNSPEEVELEGIARFSSHEIAATLRDSADELYLPSLDTDRDWPTDSPAWVAQQIERYTREDA